MRIVVLDGFTLNPGDNPWDGLARLGELTVHDRTPPGLLIDRAFPADVLITNKAVIDAAALEKLPNLRFIAVTATGYNVVDAAAAGRRGIPVANVPEYGSDAVAQHVIALLLELTNHVGLHDGAAKGGEWGKSHDFCFWKVPLVELAGKKLGLVGFGNIGRKTAAIAHALGMEILVFAPRAKTAPPLLPVTWTGLSELFVEADVISLHCPLTSDNAGFVNRELLSCMKPSAFLINTARGGLINEADLADALNGGVIAGAAVDVVSAEPIHANNPLLSARNCIITPHIAWASLEARKRLMARTVANVEAFVAGSPVNVVNGEYLQMKPKS
ncbi:MAG: D-2-hydroxyacid dehydrogenase [Geobacter sp.]|nr:D-2-hydroxyacid dehydrogenase [Geobacter sp.]